MVEKIDNKQILGEGRNNILKKTTNTQTNISDAQSTAKRAAYTPVRQIEQHDQRTMTKRVPWYSKANVENVAARSRPSLERSEAIISKNNLNFDKKKRQSEYLKENPKTLETVKVVNNKMKLLEDTIKMHLNKIELKGATSSIKYNKAMSLFKVGEASLGTKGSMKRIALRIPRLHIKTSSNNTVMTLTDYKGNVVLSCSAGNLMFKGAKRSTPYAAESVALKIKKYLQQHKYKNLRILVNGVNKNNYTIMKKISTIRLKKINIKSLQNMTPVPHNGCRKAKKRRL